MIQRQVRDDWKQIDMFGDMKIDSIKVRESVDPMSLSHFLKAIITYFLQFNMPTYIIRFSLSKWPLNQKSNYIFYQYLID